MTPLEPSRAVRAICQAVADQESVELVDVVWRKSGRRKVLEVIIDVEGGVDVDLLTAVSERVSQELDIGDPIPDSYLLEVCSAGLERPLVKPSDFVRFTGRQVSLRCFEPVAGSTRFEGVIESAGDDSFLLAPGGSPQIQIPYSLVRKATLVVDWDAELRRANTIGGNR